MAKNRISVVGPNKPLFEALDAGYRHHKADIFRWTLESYLHWVGIPDLPAQNIPESAGKHVHAALDAYITAVAAREPFSDILGEVYMACAGVWGRETLAQYFTPAPVAEMMSLMLVGDDSGTPKAGGDLWRTIDPCVGSGALMLAFSRVIMKQHGAQALQHWSVTGVDLDMTCARMFAVQMLANCSLHGLSFGEIVVMQGNSLSMDPGDYKLVLHATSPSVQRQPAARHPVRLQRIAEAARQSGVKPPEQLHLFEEQAA